MHVVPRLSQDKASLMHCASETMSVPAKRKNACRSRCFAVLNLIVQKQELKLKKCILAAFSNTRKGISRFPISLFRSLSHAKWKVFKDKQSLTMEMFEKNTEKGDGYAGETSKLDTMETNFYELSFR